MRTFARFVMPFAAAVGLAVAFGPAAGATTTGFRVPGVQVVNFPTSFSLTSPCNGSTVDTAGSGTVITTAIGERALVSISDRESGDGYDFTTYGVASFRSLAPEYLVPVRATWIDPTDMALDFHASFRYTVTVNSRNTPIGFFVSGVTGVCGI
jgi:hypothetical protein